MNPLNETTICCPYCGEFIELVIDCTQTEQDYIEDCQICCCPIIISLTLSDSGEMIVAVRNENES